jgi:predicted membrane channel-forming protein YqfA (hemolysin III family)
MHASYLIVCVTPSSPRVSLPLSCHCCSVLRFLIDHSLHPHLFIPTHPPTQTLYTGVFAFLAVMGMVFLYVPYFDSPRWLAARVGSFIAIGLYILVPMLHYGQVKGFDAFPMQMIFLRVSFMGFLYIAGACIGVVGGYE